MEERLPSYLLQAMGRLAPLRCAASVAHERNIIS